MNVRVFLNHFGSRMPVGILAQQGLEILFQYAPDFLERNIALSPYFLPLRSEIFCDHKHTFDGLFGVFHDSLPDGWGLLLLDRVLSRIGRSLAQTSPLERLTLAGSNAMGALEYEPDMSSTTPEEMLMEPDTLARESERLLGEHSYKGGYIDTLLSLSGSLSGARPKISISLPDRNGLPVPWIVKFRSLQDAPDAGLQEYRLSLAAQKAGVDMPQTRLLPSKTC
ncbi:MAG: type II toxin-antitoxin system HipA family toxin, partial [Candidatus Desulfovibrio faecigallinarum]|nr:type II toxin-antitoxin system HipA family toxin [Candidatus Desulfovibrio faecigallinarum]